MKKLFIVVFYNKTGNAVKSLPIFGETETTRSIDSWSKEQNLGEIEEVDLFQCKTPTKVFRLDWTNKTAAIIFPQTEQFTEQLIEGKDKAKAALQETDELPKVLPTKRGKRPRNSIKGGGYVRPLVERAQPNFEGIERPKG